MGVICGSPTGVSLEFSDVLIGCRAVLVVDIGARTNDGILNIDCCI